MTAKITFHWATKKTATGFEAIVRQGTQRTTPNATGSYVDSIEMQRVPCKSRAIAKTHAIKWCQYYRASIAA